MPATNIQLLRMYKNLFGTALTWLISFSLPFPSPRLPHVFILLPKRYKIGILICYLAYINFIRLSIGLQGWSLKFLFFLFFSWPFSISQIPLDLPTALPNLQQ